MNTDLFESKILEALEANATDKLCLLTTAYQEYVATHIQALESGMPLQVATGDKEA